MRFRHTHHQLFAALACGIALAALCCSPGRAATLSWGTSGTGGTGTWSTGTNTWWNGATMQAWNNANSDDAVFTFSPGTVTLTTSNTANSLTFGSYVGTYTLALNGQTLAIGGGGITLNATSGAATLSGAGAVLLTLPQTWTNNASFSTLTVSSTVNNNGNLLTIAGRGNTTVGGTIAGSGGLTKSGNGLLTLTGSSTYTGTTTINSGTLTLSGLGIINASSGLVINGGVLNLVNANATEGAYNRLGNSAPIASSVGGTINYTNTSGAGVNYAETTGTLALTGGQFNIVLTNSQAGSQTLTLAGLTQSGQATAAFASGGGLNATTNRIQVTGATATSAGQIIGPWLTVGTSAAAQTDYATYNASGYVLPAAIAAVGQSDWTNASNAYSFDTAETLSALRAITALRYSGASAGTLDLASSQLQTSGVLAGGAALTIAASAGGSLTTQSGGGNLYLTAGNGALTVNAPIVDNGGAVNVVKSGGSTLTLAGVNTYTGVTAVNAGTLVANSSLSLPGFGTSGRVQFAGGTLQVALSGSNWTMGEVDSLVSNATETAGTLAIDVPAGSSTQSAGWNLGSVGLAKLGAGTLVLSQSNAYTGPTVVGGGTLQIANANAISSNLSLTGSATVVVGSPISLNSLVFSSGSSTISGTGTLNFGAGGSITNAVLANQTISVGIFGSPAVAIMDNASAVITFAPTTATQTLGTVTVPYEAGSSDKATLTLDGTTTGNSVSRITFASGNQYGTVVKQGVGTWAVGDVDIGALTLTAGNLVVNGAINTFNQGLNLNGGVLHYNNAAVFGASGGITFNGAALDNTSGAAITTSANNRPFAVGANLTFLGSNGAGSDLTLGTGTVTLSNNIVTGNPVVTVQNAATTLTVGGNIVGAGIGLTKAGPGTLKLSGTGFYSGPTLVTSGTLLVSSTLAVQNSPLVTTGAGVVRLDTGIITPVFGGVSGTSGDLATIISSGYSAVTRLTLNPQSGVSVTYGGAIADGAAGMNLVKTGSGTQTLSGNNTYTGTTTVSAGTLVVSSSGALPGFDTSGRVVFNGGTLQVPVNGTAWTMAQVDTLLTNSTKTSGFLGLDIASGTQTQGPSAWTNAIGLTKLGNGTLELNQANTYSGTTTVTAGTLLLNGASGAIASSGAVAVGVAGGPSVVLTLDSSASNNADRIGSVPVTLSNARVNLVGNASAATAETVGLLSAASGDSVVAISGGAAGQVAQLISTSGTIARAAGATLSILADGSTQQFAFTGGSAGINKGVFYGSSAATANEFAYYPGSGGAVTAPVYGTTTGFAAATSSALTANQHNKLSGSIASQAAVSINSLNMPGNFGLTALTGNLTFNNAADQGAIIKSGGGAAQIGTAGNLFDIVGQAGGELVVNTVAAADNLTLNVGIAASTTALTKTGAGTLTFTANRNYSYTGATSVNAGTLLLTSSAANGYTSSITTINNGGTVRLGAAGKIVDTGTVAVNAGGTFDLAGFSDTIAVLSGSGSVTNTTATTGTLTVGSASTFAGVISGSLGLTLNSVNNSTQAFTLSGSNTYTGLTLLSGANLKWGATNAIRSGNNLTIQEQNSAIYQSLDLAGFDQTLGNLRLGGGWGGGNTVVYNSTGSSTLTITNGITTGLVASTQNAAVTISVTMLDLGGSTQSFDVQDLSPANDLTVSSVIRNGGLTKTNAGLLLLTGSNIYDGKTSIANGTISVGRIGSVGAIGNLGQPTGANATIDLGTTTTAGRLLYTGSGESTDRVINLAGTTGGGTLDQSGSGLVRFTSDLTATGAGLKTLTLQGSTSGTGEISGAIVNSSGGATAVTKSGTGLWVLSGNNTYTGTTTLSGGVLSVSGSANLGGGTLTFNGGTLQVTGTTLTNFGGRTVTNTGNIAFDIADAANTFTFAATGTGAIGLTKSGAGTLVVSGTNTFTGSTLVNAGTLQIASPLAIQTSALDTTGAGSYTLGTITGGTLTLGGLVGTSGTLGQGAQFGSGYTGAITALRLNPQSGTTTYLGVIADGATGMSLTKTGAGMQILSGANTYTGTTTLTAGLLSISAANNLGVGGPLVFNGGGLQVTNSLTSLGGRSVLFTSGSSVTIDVVNPSNTFTPGVAFTQGLGGLTKNGAGTLLLNQANTYIGATTIGGGVLQIGDSGTTGSLSGAGPIFNSAALTVRRSDTLTQSTGIGFVISGTGSVTNVGNGTLVLDRPNFYSGLTRASSGTIQITNTFAIRNSAIDAAGAGRVSLGGGVTAPVIGGLSGTTGVRTLSAIFDATSYAAMTSLTLNPPSGFTVTYSGTVDGALSLTMAGAGTQQFTNPQSYTGTTSFVQGLGNTAAGTLQLTGSGALTSSAAYVFAGGNLLLTNTNSAQGAMNRLNDDSPITSNGGTLTFNNTTPAAIYAETTGTVTLASGQFNIVLGTNVSGTQTLTLRGLTQAATTSGSQATVTFSAATTGPLSTGTGNRIVVSGRPDTAAGAIIGPWATVGTAAGTPTDYAVYGGGGGFVIAAGTSAVNNTASTWTSGSNPVVSSTTFSLGSSAAANTVRYTGTTGTMALGAFQLQTNGILQIGSGALTISGSSLTTPSGGGNLFLTTNASNMTVSGTITNAPDGGVVTLVKSGNGTLTLSGSNSFTGPVVINGGGVTLSTLASWGASGKNVTFASNGTLASSVDGYSAGTLTVNPGVIATINPGNLTFATTTGSGSVVWSTSSSKTLNLGDASGLTGDLKAKLTGNANYNTGVSIQFSRLADAAGSALQFEGGTSDGNQAMTVALAGDAGPLTFDNRQVQILPRTQSNQIMRDSVLANNNTNASNIWVINTNLLMLSPESRMFVLSGGNVGNNRFAGVIGDGLGQILLKKDGNGTWLLSGTNTYTAGTQINAGTLGIGNSGALGVSTVQLSGGALRAFDTDVTLPNANSLTANSTISGTQSLTLAGPFTNNGVQLTSSITPGTGNKLLTFSGTTFLQSTTSGTGQTFTLAGTGNTLFAGPIVNGGVAGNSNFAISNTGTTTLVAANTYTGTTTVSAGRVVVNSLANGGVASSIGMSSNANGNLVLSGGTLSYAPVSGSGGGATTTDRRFTLSGNAAIDASGTGVLVFSNTGSLAYGTTNATRTLTLAGTNAGSNTLSAVMADNGSGKVGVTKVGNGTWVLAGANTYSGTTAIQGGVLEAVGVSLSGSSYLQLAGGVLQSSGSFTRANSTTAGGANFQWQAVSGSGGGFAARGGKLTVAVGNNTSQSQTWQTTAGSNAILGTLKFGSATADSEVDFQNPINLNSGTRTIEVTAGVGGDFARLSGPLSNGSIVKTGSGTLVLSGSNGQANTTVSEGQLNVDTFSALGTLSGTFSMAAGTRLDNTSGTDLTVTNPKTIVFGTSMTYVGSNDLDLGTGNVLLSGTTEFDIQANELTLSGDVIGVGYGIIKTGTGTLRLDGLSGSSSFDGNSTINAGKLLLEGNAVLGGGTSTLVTLGSNGFLQVGPGASLGNVTVAGFTGNLISASVVNANQDFTESVTLTETNELYNGVQTIFSGVTVTTGHNYLGTVPGSDTPGRIVFQDNARLRVTTGFEIDATQGISLASGTAVFESAANQALLIPSTVSGSGGILKVGAGNVRLTGSNTYLGGTVISQGIVGISYGESLGDVSGRLLLDGGTVVAAQTLSGPTVSTVTIDPARDVVLTNGKTSGMHAQSGLTLRYDGVIGEENPAGAAAGLLFGAVGPREGTVILGGNNTYRGATTVAAGTLRIGAGGTTGSIDDASPVSVASGARLAFDRSDALTYGGTISGAGIVEKLGAGTLSLTAAQLYTGNTIISGGTLALGSGASIAQSAYIQAGTAASPVGVLDVSALAGGLPVAAGQKLGGYGTVLGDVLIAGGAIIAPGGSIGSLTNTGTQTWGGGGEYEFEITNAKGTTPGTDWDLLTVDWLNITATEGDRFVLDLQTLATGTSTTASPMDAANWDPAGTYQWKFLVATNTSFGPGNFNLNWFNIQTGSFLNDTTGGQFTVAYGGSGGLGGSTQSNELYIVYAAVPEPGTLVLAGIGLAGLALRLRRRR